MENKSIKKFDLLKIGIFLLGISGIIISFVVLKIYLKIEKSEESSRLYSYCSDKNIIINSRGKPSKNVKVLDAQNKSVCVFNEIPENSKELCVVGGSGFFSIQANGKKDIVECREKTASGKPDFIPPAD